MSTKLYDGLKLIDPTVDLFKLSAWVSAAVRPVFRELSEALVAEELVGYIDEPRRWVDEFKRSWPFMDAELNWQAQQQLLGASHTLNDPLRFSMVFGRSSAGNILCYPYCWEPAYRAALLELGIFEDYHYQNQSDRPDELTESQWESRAAEWDSLMNAEGTFGDLPLWQLPGSAEPFREVSLSARSESFDPNSWVSAQKRLKRRVVAALMDYAAGRMGELDSAKLMATAFEANGLVSEYLAGPGALLPEPEPVPRGSYFEYSELPAPYEVDGALVETLYGELLSRLSSK